MSQQMDMGVNSIPAMDNYTFNETSSDVPSLVVSYWEQVLTSVLVILLGITGITGNTMIILAVAFSRKLQTSTNAFIASLAATDLLTSIFVIFHGIGTLGKNGWLIPEAEWLCSLTAFVVYAGTGTSLWHLGIIAVNRLTLIIKPFLYQRIFTRWTIICLIMISWFIPSGAQAIILLNGIGIIGYDDVDLTCSVLEESKGADLSALLMTLINYPVPLGAILISYTWIYIYLKRHFRTKKKNIDARSPPVRSQTPVASMSTSNPDPTMVPSTSSNHQLLLNQQNLKSEIEMKVFSSCVAKTRVGDAKDRISCEEIKITKNLFLVVCSFLLCFTPYFTLLFIPDAQILLFYSRVLILGNSSINFVIYASRHPVFRVVLRHMMRCSYAEIPQPTKLVKFLIKNGD